MYRERDIENKRREIEKAIIFLSKYKFVGEGFLQGSLLMYFIKKKVVIQKRGRGGKGVETDKRDRETERKSQTESVREIVKEGERLRE